MTRDTGGRRLIEIARRIASDFAEFAQPHTEGRKPVVEASPSPDELPAEFDRRVTDPDLRTATRSRFVSKHYADAVEAGVKALNECVRARTGRTEDGDALMTLAFSPNAPLLRTAAGTTRVSSVGTCTCAKVWSVRGGIRGRTR